jgi:hypothetical protein
VEVYAALRSLNSRIINRANARLAKAALIEFHRFQRGSKCIKVKFLLMAAIRDIGNIKLRGFSRSGLRASHKRTKKSKEPG